MRIDDRRPSVAVSVIGSAAGEPLIVLPGGPCRGPEYLGDLAGLGDERPLVVMHPRGTPLSGGLSRGWWRDADDVVSLIDALGLKRAGLLAHSAGTRLALAVMTRYPDRVRSLVLVTPPATWLTGTPHDGDSVMADRTDRALIDARASVQNDDPDTEEAFRAAFLRQAPASYARWTERERTHAETGAVSLAAARAWFTDIPSDAVDRIRAAAHPPTLIVGGYRDILTGVRPVAEYAAMLDTDASFLPDCGHYPWIEQPTAFRAALDPWLAARRS